MMDFDDWYRGMEFRWSDARLPYDWLRAAWDASRHHAGIDSLRRDARIGQLVRRRLAEGLVATITPHEVHDIDAEGGGDE